MKNKLLQVYPILYSRGVPYTPQISPYRKTRLKIFYSVEFYSWNFTSNFSSISKFHLLPPIFQYGRLLPRPPLTHPFCDYERIYTTTFSTPY